MSYIGRGLQSGAFRQLDDISSGFDGSDTTHTMQVNSTNVTVGDVNQILLSLGGVIQKPGTDFTVSGSVLTFTTAPAANTSFFAVLLGSDNGGTVTPTDGSVTTAKIVDDAVTGAKLADDIAITTTGNVSVDGGSFTFNESGASVDLRAETDAQTHALFIDGSANAIGLFNSAPSFTADTGMHLADDVKIGFGTGGSSRPDFQLNADSSNLKLACGFGADTADINISTGAAISTGQETAPDVDGNGLCLNQLTNDGRIMTFKSTGDVAHGRTSYAETDTFAKFSKTQSQGGLSIEAYNGTSGAYSLYLTAGASGEDTTKSTSAQGPTYIANRVASGTSFLSVGSNANMFVVANTSSAKFIVDAEGDLHADGSATSVYDNYEDAQLVRALDLSKGQEIKGLINSKFDQYINYNHETLANAGLVGREEDGTPNHFINVTGMQRLHNGAIWQQYEKHQKLAEAVYEMAKEALGEDKADAILEKHDIKLLN
jgi:hypothetical protein